MKVVWHAAAEASLLRIPHWRTSGAVSAAVLRYAEHGEGNPARVVGRPGLFELRASGYRVLFTVIGDEVQVWTVQRIA